ncbi:YegP family protein [Pedobacter sp. UBA5917]|jgi:uncharacterized protein YegP (UPF0339 family)|uniref:YegP family protein n=1 Tax=Pedobacter sp. UBA5917 TaxID=1947061 RepID=UPI0025F1BDF4|nr:YegP family protein [Pedobacter sp. UBA5917]
MKNPKFQVFRSEKNSEYYYRLRAANGEIILSGEGYTTKQNCLNGISSVKVNALHDKHFIRKDAVGNYTFNLKAANGEIIGRSENYTTAANRENGIDAIKRIAPDALIEDIT